MYDWEPHKETIRRLYVDEAREVDEIIEYMRVHHDFHPSKRAYATRLRLWKFPSRQQPAFKNEPLVARVKELWERNVSQSEMLRVLTEEDGFSISHRELSRVRSMNRWLLRKPAENARRARSGSARDSNIPGGSCPDGPQQNDHVDADGPIVSDDAEPDGEASDSMVERQLLMEAESAERWATKRRRRRTREYAGLPPDPPGPPRFPSETTLAQSRVILGLNKATYTAVREEFKDICQSQGISKKKLAGPEAWGRAKNMLLGAFPALEEVAAWLDGGDEVALERRRVALDTICCDVTKRMRASANGTDKLMPLADAKNMLALNPTKSMEVRTVLQDMLKKSNFTSKVALGKDGWEELKQRWVDQTESLREALSRSNDGSDCREEMNKAVDALASDAMKRLRAERGRLRSGKNLGIAVAEAEAMDNAEFDDGDAAMAQMNQDASGFATAMLGADQPAHTHPHPPRLMPVSNQLVDTQMDMQIPMDPQLDTPLLMDPNAQGGFMGSHQQFISAPGPLQAAPPPFDNQQATPYSMPTAASTNIVPVYVRQVGPGDTLGDLWIVLLTSPTPSLQELQDRVAEKFPGTRCVQVDGMLRMPNGMGGHQLFPLTIVDDAQLGAHLAQDGAPVFHVRLSL